MDFAFCFTGGGELLSTEPSLVQQHSFGCYGGSLSFESVFPSGLPALSKAQEGNLSDLHFIYYFWVCYNCYLIPNS